MAFELDLSLVVTSILTIITILVIVFFNHRQYKQVEGQLKIQNKQLKFQNEQIKHNFFAEYTRRYQDIILHFPQNINENSFCYEGLSDEERDIAMRYMRVYFDLCSEEYFLHQKGFLDDEVWREWEQGMLSSFKKPAYKTAWEKLSDNSDFYTKFKEFVDSQILTEMVIPNIE